ncbi:MAG TPA: BrnT family toxin [Croceibacterium sp.]
MAIVFDPAKRAQTLAGRGLDFADADEVIDGAVWEFVDDRIDYGEVRVTTIGFLRQRMVVVVWTRRGEDRHVISMRKANHREQRRYAKYLD